DAPHFKVALARGDQFGRDLFDNRAPRSDVRPRDGTKEADRFVLQAIPLKIVCSELFVLSRLCPSRSVRRTSQQRHDAGLVGSSILPDDRLAKGLVLDRFSNSFGAMLESPFKGIVESKTQMIDASALGLQSLNPGGKCGKRVISLWSLLFFEGSNELYKRF